MDVVRGNLISERNFTRSLLTILALGAIVGCSTQQAGQSLHGNGDGDPDVSIRPMVLCGEGRGVVSVSDTGSVSCNAPVLKGMAPEIQATGEAACAEGEIIETRRVPGASGDLVVPSCSDPENQNPDGMTFGSGPTTAFSCPPGSSLKGFSEQGEPLCWSVVNGNIMNLGFMRENCPWGMASGNLEHAQFSLPTCLYDGRSPRQMRLMGQRVIKKSQQRNQLCAGELVVIGFDEDFNIICGAGPQGLKKRPSRYWATQFDNNPELPLCRIGYVAAAVHLRWEGSTQTVKVWTCVRSDLR
jgi:hypothetical protein